MHEHPIRKHYYAKEVQDIEAQAIRNLFLILSGQSVCLARHSPFFLKTKYQIFKRVCALFAWREFVCNSVIHCKISRTSSKSHLQAFDATENKASTFCSANLRESSIMPKAPLFLEIGEHYPSKASKSLNAHKN